MNNELVKTKQPTQDISRKALVSNAPSVFHYDNYRLYLKDWYVQKKNLNSAFSFRNLSRMAGFSSPNFFKLVMDGQRNLSTESIQRCLRFLKLTPKAADYFRTLVAMNQDPTTEGKLLHAQQLMSLRSSNTKFQIMTEAQRNYYTNWYTVVIREMIALPHFQNDPFWIAQELIPNITPAQAAESLEQLIELGLAVEKDDGSLAQSSAVMSLGDEVISILVKKYLRLMAARAADALDTINWEDRDISSLTLTLDRDSFALAKQIIADSKKQLLSLAEKSEAQAQGVYQMNFHLFPVTKGACTKEIQV